MGLINNHKARCSRTKRTTEEKLRALAEKEVLRLAKTDDNILRQIIKKYCGIDVPPESERQLSHLMERTKLDVFRTVSDGFADDPEVREAVRDQYLDILFGIKTPPPKRKERGGYPQEPNPRRKVENMIETIQKVDQLKKALGVDTGGWAKVLQNPEVIKGILGVIQAFTGSIGQSPESNGSSGIGQKYAIEEDRNLVGVDYKTYMQDRSKAKGPKLPGAGPEISAQVEPAGKPVISDTNTLSPLPPTVSPASKPESLRIPIQKVFRQIAAVQSNNRESFRDAVSKIMAAMDEPAEEFAKNTAESARSGDQVATHIQEFLLAHSYDDVMRDLSHHPDAAKRFEEHKQWYEQVTTALRNQKESQQTP